MLRSRNPSGMVEIGPVVQLFAIDVGLDARSQLASERERSHSSRSPYGLGRGCCQRVGSDPGYRRGLPVLVREIRRLVAGVNAI